MSERYVARDVRWPVDRNVTIPFILRDNRLVTFADLSRSNHPFADVTARERAEVADARKTWADPEGHRRYVALLNKVLTKHLSRAGVRYDNEHRRYWFTAEPGPASRRVRYRTKQGRSWQRDVVRQRVRKSTGELKEWWHVAAGLRFERVASDSWVLTVRPEYQLTSDGATPLPGKQQGARTTRKKSRLYNEGYLDLLHFWREFLLADRPRLIINAADQRLIIDQDLVACTVAWPGVPGDHRGYAPRRADDDLFSAFEHAEAIEALELDESGWWDEYEEAAL